MLTIILLLCNILLVAGVACTALKNKRQQKEAKAAELRKMKCNMYYYLERLNYAMALMDIFTLHIQMWGAGIRHQNFGPDQFGMFRTLDILRMKPTEVFLGNIYGRNTLSLDTWSRTGDKEDKQIVLNQYKNLLISNLKVMIKQLEAQK